LHPETPSEGRLIADLFRGHPVDIKGMMVRLKSVANELGLPIGDRDMTYNSRLAQELGLWAETEGAGDAFHMAAFKAYFAEGKNIAEISVLSDLAVAVGLSAETAENILKNRLFQEPVDKDWADARELMITAVPTFFMHEDRLVGAQPYEMLENFVMSHGVDKPARN